MQRKALLTLFYKLTSIKHESSGQTVADKKLPVDAGAADKTY